VLDRQKVLIIGNPIVYELVDDELLKKNQLDLYFVFKKTDRNKISNKRLNVFVESLVVGEIKKIILENNIDNIVCFDDQFLLNAAALRDEFKYIGLGHEEMKRFKYKSQMNNVLKKNMSTIPFISFTPSLSYQDLCVYFNNPPFFAKPDSSAGSEGTMKINNKEDYNFLIKCLSKDPRDFIIQPFLEGNLYHCELIIQDNKVIYSQARRYSYPNFNILLGKVIASFPIGDCYERKEIESLAMDVQKLLNFGNGVMHTEFFKNSCGEFVFLETNIRPAGGGINLIHKNRLGISLETAMILLELRKSIHLTVNTKKLYTSGYIPMKKGRVIGFEYPEFKGRIDFNERVKRGDICYNPRSASDAALSYIGEYDTIKDMEDDFKIIESFDIVKYSEH